MCIGSAITHRSTSKDTKKTCPARHLCKICGELPDRDSSYQKHVFLNCKIVTELLARAMEMGITLLPVKNKPPPVKVVATVDDSTLLGAGRKRAVEVAFEEKDPIAKVQAKQSSKRSKKKNERAARFKAAQTAYQEQQTDK